MYKYSIYIFYRSFHDDEDRKDFISWWWGPQAFRVLDRLKFATSPFINLIWVSGTPIISKLCWNQDCVCCHTKFLAVLIKIGLGSCTITFIMFPTSISRHCPVVRMPPVCRSVPIYAFPHRCTQLHTISMWNHRIRTHPHTNQKLAHFRVSTTLIEVLFEYVWVPFYYRIHYVTRCRIHPIFHSMQMATDLSRTVTVDWHLRVKEDTVQGTKRRE